MAPIKGYRQNGLRLLRRKIAVQGMRAVDWRSAGARDLIEWKQQLITDLGTEENLTTGQKTLIDVAMRTRLFLDHIDGFLLGEESFIFKGKKSAWPLLMQRMALVASLERTLATLGLERQAKKLPSLQEYLAAKEKGSEAPQSTAEPIDISSDQPRDPEPPDPEPPEPAS